MRVQPVWPQFTAPPGTYVAYKLTVSTSSSPGYEKAQCVIEYSDFVVVVGSTAGWVGIDNNFPNDWVFIQAGWIVQAGWTEGELYYEYRQDDGFYSSIVLLGPPPAGGATYGARKNGDVIDIIVLGVSAQPLQWSQFDNYRLCGAQFGVEIQPANTDGYTFGSLTDPCDFSSAKVRQLGGSDTDVDFSSLTPYQEATNGRIVPTATGAFKTWDVRNP